MALQIRRGTEADRLSVTPLAGELLFTTDTKQLFIGDGITAGGVTISEQAQDALDSLVTGVSHTGIYFTYDDVANTLTATVTGGVDSLETLTNVTISGPVNDEILKYAEGVGWINGSIGIDTLTDVSVITPAENETLMYDGANWVNGNVPVESLSDVSVLNPLLGDILKYESGGWANNRVNVEELGNVSLNNLISGEVLKWNGIQWVNAPDELGQTSGLNGLSDVNLVSPAFSEFLQYDGVTWTNVTLTTYDLTDFATFGELTGQTLKYTSAGWTNSFTTLDDNQDVSLSVPQLHDVLSFDGANWVNSAVTLNSLPEVSLFNVADGDILVYDSTTSQWVNNINASITSVFDDPIPTLSNSLNIDVYGIYSSIGFSATVETGMDSTSSFVVRSDKFIGELWNSNVVSYDDTVVVNAGEKTVNARINTDSITIGSSTAGAYPTIYSTGEQFGSLYGIAGGPSSAWFEMLSARTSHDAPEAVQEGDYLSGMLFKAYNGDATTPDYVLTTAVGSVVDGAPNGVNVPGKFIVLNQDDQGSSHYLTFNSAGVLQVETVAPTVTIQQPVYTDATARDTAIATPSEGMMVFNAALQKFQGYVSDTGLAAGGASNATPGWIDLH